MSKSSSPKTNGNVFKSIVRTVVREEMGGAEKRLDRRFEILTQDVLDKIDDKFEDSFTKYRDETLTKLDKILGEVKKRNEESTAHIGSHREINNRLDDLVRIHPHNRHV